MIEKILNDPVRLAIGASIVLVVVYLIGRRAVTDTADAIANINAGTPYAGGGAVGTLGNIVNRATGGVPQAIGEGISSWFSPPFNADAFMTFAVLFPDGTKHAINASDISRDGYFNGSRSVYPWHDGKNWRIGINQAGVRVAVPAKSASK